MIQFVGHGFLGSDPLIKFISKRDGSGQLFVASLNVRFVRNTYLDSHPSKNRVGFWREVEMYGAKGQELAKHLIKGTHVLVVGQELEYTRSYDDGYKTKVIKIMAQEVGLILSRIQSITFRTQELSLVDDTGDESSDPKDASQSSDL